MSENTPESAVETAGAPYTEDENFVPDPTGVYGTLDTSATAGGAHENIEKVSPVFEAARAQDLAAAADAVEDGDTSSVVLPTDAATDPSAEDDADALDRLKDAAAEAEGTVIQDPSQEQDPANDPAKTDSGEVSANVEADQRAASPAGGTGGTGGEGTTKTSAKSTTSTKK